MWAPGNGVILADFGFAVPAIQPRAKYAGTFRYASDRILQFFGQDDVSNCPTFLIKPSTLDDLHSLIRSAFILSRPHLLGKLRSFNSGIQILDFWNTQFVNHPAWKDLSDSITIEILKLGATPNYELIKAALVKLV